MTDTIIGEESEMLHLQGIFAKAANAIVEASQLRKEVAALQVQMTALSNSFEQLKASNEQLVSELTAVRQEKQELQGKLHSAEVEIHNLKYNLDFVTSERDGLKEDVRKLQEKLDSAQRDIYHLTTETTDRLEAIHKLRADNETIRETIREAYKKYIADSAVFEDVIYKMTEEPKAEGAEEEPSTLPEWKAEEVKAFPEAPVPFVQSPGQSLGNGEQPRAEDGKFEPVPMVARHFE